MDAITFIDCFMANPIAKRAFLLVSGPKRALYELFSRGVKGTKGEFKINFGKGLLARACEPLEVAMGRVSQLAVMSSIRFLLNI